MAQPVKITKKTQPENKAENFERIKQKKQANIVTNFPQTEQVLHEAERVDRILNDLLELTIRKELVRKDKYAAMFALDNTIDTLMSVCQDVRKLVKRTAATHRNKKRTGDNKTVFLTWTQTSEVCGVAMQVDYILSDLKVLSGNRSISMDEYYKLQQRIDEGIKLFHTTISDIRKTVRQTGKKRRRGKTLKLKEPGKTADQFPKGSAAAMVAKQKTTTPVKKDTPTKKAAAE